MKRLVQQMVRFGIVGIVSFLLDFILMIVLKKACSAIENCTYVDTAPLADEGNANIYSGDGIHFTKSFYTDWLNAIVDSMDN